MNLSIDEAVQLARHWFPIMAQPFTKEHQLGVALLTQEMLDQNRHLDKNFEHVLAEID
jgi:hypothetical protein